MAASPSPPSPALPYPPSALHSGAYDHPPFATRPSLQTYGSSPRSRNPTANSGHGSSPGRHGGLSAGFSSTNALTIVGNSSTAIAKALNMASLKLFGSPSENIWLRRRGHRRPVERTTHPLDPAEERLLDTLEDIALKATVIFDFADSKFFLMAPQSQLELHASSASPFFATAQPQTLNAKPRRASSASSDKGPSSPLGQANDQPASSNNSSKPELLPGETLVLYLKALAFLQKGIAAAKVYWATKGATGQTASQDLNDCEYLFMLSPRLRIQQPV